MSSFDRSAHEPVAWPHEDDLSPDEYAGEDLLAPTGELTPTGAAEPVWHRAAPSGDLAQLEGAARDAAIKRTCDFLRPDGKPIGERGTSSRIRVMSGGLTAAQQDYDYLYKAGVKGVYGPGTPIPASAKDVLEQIKKAVAA